MDIPKLFQWQQRICYENSGMTSRLLDNAKDFAPNTDMQSVCFCRRTKETLEIQGRMPLTCNISVEIAEVFLANIAQCNAVLPCVASVKFGDAPNVNNNLVGSKLHIFQQDHISGVMPPLSGVSGLTPLAIKYATKAVCPNWAAK